MYRPFLLTALSSFALISCHSSDSSASDAQAATSSKGLIFTGANSQSYPWKSNVFRMDTESFAVENLLTGESGDAVVYNSDTDVLLFNRTDDSQNYRLFKPENNSFTVGQQTKFAGGVYGDPHDAIDLGSDTVLLAHYNQGALTLMKKSTGEKISDVVADWDLPSGTTLAPEALWRTTVGDHVYIYVLHQAGAYVQNLFTVNGTQQVFVLEQKGSTVAAVDLDPATAKVQGIKLKGSFPIPVRDPSQPSKLVIVGMCSAYVNANPADASQVCHNAVEELDPATQKVTTLWDLDNSGLHMNGGVAASAISHQIYVQVEQTVAGQSEKRIDKFNLDAKANETVYTYDENSGGYYGMFFDATRGNLFIGDINKDTVGKFTVLHADGTKSVQNLDAIPYSGVFVY